MCLQAGQAQIDLSSPEQRHVNSASTVSSSLWCVFKGSNNFSEFFGVEIEGFHLSEFLGWPVSTLQMPTGEHHV